MSGVRVLLAWPYYQKKGLPWPAGGQSTLPGQPTGSPALPWDWGGSVGTTAVHPESCTLVNCSHGWRAHQHVVFKETLWELSSTETKKTPGPTVLLWTRKIYHRDLEFMMNKTFFYFFKYFFLKINKAIVYCINQVNWGRAVQWAKTIVHSYVKDSSVSWRSRLFECSVTSDMANYFLQFFNSWQTTFCNSCLKSSFLPTTEINFSFSPNKYTIF